MKNSALPVFPKYRQTSLANSSLSTDHSLCPACPPFRHCYGLMWCVSPKGLLWWKAWSPGRCCWKVEGPLGGGASCKALRPWGGQGVIYFSLHHSVVLAKGLLQSLRLVAPRWPSSAGLRYNPWLVPTCVPTIVIHHYGTCISRLFFFFFYNKILRIINLRRGIVYFGLQFWSFSSWPFCFGACGEVACHGRSAL